MSELVNVEHTEFYNDKLIVIKVVDCMSLVPRFDRRSYSVSDTLVKYCEAKFSPVSSYSADCIRLARPSYYRNFEDDENSGLIGDSREGTFREASSWEERGSHFMESIKENMANFRSANLSLKITYETHNSLIYCTSMDPKTDYMRREQMRILSPLYDFMMGIEEPSKFAIQLGRDVAKQIVTESNMRSNVCAIHVYHGRVIYCDDDESGSLLGNLPRPENIMSFIKLRKFQDQQEYRFIINMLWENYEQDIFHLQVSDELRDLLNAV